MKIRTIIVAVGICALGVLATFFIPTKKAKAAPTQPIAVVTRQIIDYGNGVYWFPYMGTEYATKLSEFRKTNPHLELIGATGETGSSLAGRVFTVGFYVYFREKSQ